MFYVLWYPTYIAFCFCFVFLLLVYPVCYQFLWIVLFRLPLLYSLTFISLCGLSQPYIHFWYSLFYVNIFVPAVKWQYQIPIMASCNWHSSFELVLSMSSFYYRKLFSLSHGYVRTVRPHGYLRRSHDYWHVDHVDTYCGLLVDWLIIHLYCHSQIPPGKQIRSYNSNWVQMGDAGIHFYVCVYSFKITIKMFNIIMIYFVAGNQCKHGTRLVLLLIHL